MCDAVTEADENAGAGLFLIIRQSGSDWGDNDLNDNVRFTGPYGIANFYANPQIIKMSIKATSNVL